MYCPVLWMIAYDDEYNFCENDNDGDHDFAVKVLVILLGCA